MAAHCLPLVAALLVAASRAGGAEIVFVHGAAVQSVRFEGEPWRTDGRFLRGAGPGNALLAVPTLGAGGFRIDVWLRVDPIADSGAALRIGRNRVRLTGPGAPAVRLEGPDLGSESAVPDLGAVPPRSLPEGRFFALEVCRTGEELTIRIDGETVAIARVSSGALGEFGLEPGRAELLVYRFSASGGLELPEDRTEREDAAKLRAAVDRAIDRGVRYLLDRQLRDGSWDYVEERYPSGQTALCVYALLKSGLPPGHPAVRRGLLYMADTPPASTYTVACHLMALGATHDDAHLLRMKQLLDALLTWQSSGSWGYPLLAAEGSSRRTTGLGRSDLSNTQFAALGLRAAWLRGIEVPARVWARLLDATLTYQGPEERAVVARKPGASRSYEQALRGFCYRPGTRQPTGSMTAAGVATLAICRIALDRQLDAKADRAAREAIDLGLQWLAHRFTVAENPGHAGWLNYYLYGLERVGSILELEHIGEHHWYSAGARFLVGAQRTRGEWHAGGPEPSTCFALLFLRRATQVTAPLDDRAAPRYAADGEDCAVGIRAFGHWPMRIWISGFSAAALERFGIVIAGHKRLRVDRVEYRVDGETVATVRGDPRKPWANESYPVDHHFTARGAHTVSARVHLVRPEVPAGRDGPTEAVESGAFTARLDAAFAPWMERAARAGSLNLLRGKRLRVQTSSVEGKHTSGDLAVDGREGTAWLCAAADEAPTIQVAVSPEVRADRIVLGQAASRALDRARHDRIRRAEIRLDGRSEPLAVVFPEDVLEPAVVKLERTARIALLEIRVVERAPGGPPGRRHDEVRGPRSVGFSEIRLERD
ncbi:MAG: terpene cyclase/mutase family protein [Planctomycetes bacterium]|nr:terpene cyclase/mutase family protein [Planctomycetota bacterium]